MADDSPVLLAFTADWHTNSTIGLNPPIFHRELESQHVAGKLPRMVYRSWRKFWEIVEAKKIEYGATVYSFAVGDLGDINKHSKLQLITESEIEIQDAMSEIAEPMAQVSDYVFIVRGTEAHTGGNGKLEEWLAKDLDNVARYSERVASWWVVDAKIGGLKFQVTHHPPTFSLRPWTLDQAVSRAASIVAGTYLDDGAVYKMPDVCVWAHYHTRGAEAKGMAGVWGIFLPPWQLKTSYSHQRGGGFAAQRIGGLWMVVKAGKVLEWDWERWQPRRDKLWTTP